MGLPLALAIASTGLQIYAADQGAKAAKAQGALASRQFGKSNQRCKVNSYTES